MLDGKEITETSKQFLKNWEANKEVQKQKRRQAKMAPQGDQILIYRTSALLTAHTSVGNAPQNDVSQTILH